MKYFGCAVNAKVLKSDLTYQELIKSNFNYVCPQNEFKLNYVCNDITNFNFESGDYIADFCKKNNLALRGHCFLWHHAIPNWLTTSLTQDEAWLLVYKYMHQMIERYSVISWDVCNECFNNEGEFRKHLIYILGNDYISKSFKLVRSIDPYTPLFYCDNQIKSERKWHVVIKCLQAMKNDGVPINGVALQAHSNLYPELSCSATLKLINKLKYAGFLVHCPEIVVWNNQAFAYYGEMLQLEIYKGIIKACLQSDLIGFWAPFDKHPWILKPEQCCPGFWDADYHPKKSHKLIKQISQVLR